MGMCCCPCLWGQPCQPRHPACLPHPPCHGTPAPAPSTATPSCAPAPAALHGSTWKCLGKILPQPCAPFLAIPVLVGRPLHPAPQPCPPPALPSRTTPPSPYPRPFLAAPLPLLSPLPPTPNPPHGAPNRAQPPGHHLTSLPSASWALRPADRPALGSGRGAGGHGLTDRCSKDGDLTKPRSGARWRDPGAQRPPAAALCPGRRLRSRRAPRGGGCQPRGLPGPPTQPRLGPQLSL